MLLSNVSAVIHSFRRTEFFPEAWKSAPVFFEIEGEKHVHGTLATGLLGACSAMVCAVSLNMDKASVSHSGDGYTGALCLFSKPLPDMDWCRLAQAAKTVGFDGIDLTVRRGGHVRPERAAEDSPKRWRRSVEKGWTSR